MRIKSTRLLLVVLMLFAVGTVSAVELEKLLVNSVGGERAMEKIRRTKSYHVSGSVSLNGMPGRFVEHVVPPDRYYMEMRFEQFNMIQAYDGHIAWQNDLNGQVSLIEGQEEKELLKNIYLASYAYLPTGFLPNTVSFLRTLSENGRSFHEVAFTPLEADTIFLYFDSASGLLDRTVSRMDNLTVTNQLSNYGNIDGIIYPLRSVGSVAEVGLSVEVTVEQLEFDREIEPTLFALPAGSNTDFHFPVGSDKLDIPVTYRRGHIRLPVTINGLKKVWMILDSGSSHSILNRSAIADLELAQVTTLPAIGVSGYADVALVATDSLNIGDLTLYDQVAGSLPLEGGVWQGEQGLDFGGILGYDFLSRFPILIDYQNSILTVFNPDGFEAPPGGRAMDFFLTMQVPTVEAELIGIKGDFIVDLGNAFGLVVHHRFARDNSLAEQLSDVRDNPTSIGGIGGAVGGRSAYAATFRMGDILLQSIRVLLPDSAAGLAGSERLAGNIGNLVLENFRVLFDYSRRRLILYDMSR